MNSKNNTRVMFIGNVANTYGGAIYVEESAFWTKIRMKCFLSIDSKGGQYYVEFKITQQEKLEQICLEGG